MLKCLFGPKRILVGILPPTTSSCGIFRRKIENCFKIDMLFKLVSNQNKFRIFNNPTEFSLWSLNKLLTKFPISCSVTKFNFLQNHVLISIFDKRVGKLLNFKIYPSLFPR